MSGHHPHHGHAHSARWDAYGPRPPPRYSEKEVAKSDAVLAWAHKEFAGDADALEFVSRACTYRYLVTYDWDVKKVGEKLRLVMAWRRANVLPTASCPVCAPGGGGKGGGAAISAGDKHCIACPGLDRFGRPIIYFNLSRLRDKTPKAVIAHLAAVNEGVFDPADDGQMLFIMDARGVSLFGSGMGREMAVEFISVFTMMYPERMGTLVLLEPPTMLSVLISAVKPFMDASTARKITTVRTADADSLLAWALGGGPDDVGAAEGADTRAWITHVMRSDPKAEPETPPLPQKPAQRAQWRSRRAVAAAAAAGAAGAAAPSAPPLHPAPFSGAAGTATALPHPFPHAAGGSDGAAAPASATSSRRSSRAAADGVSATGSSVSGGAAVAADRRVSNSVAVPPSARSAAAADSAPATPRRPPGADANGHASLGAAPSPVTAAGTPAGVGSVRAAVASAAAPLPPPLTLPSLPSLPSLTPATASAGGASLPLAFRSPATAGGASHLSSIDDGAALTGPHRFRRRCVSLPGDASSSGRRPGVGSPGRSLRGTIVPPPPAPPATARIVFLHEPRVVWEWYRTAVDEAVQAAVWSAPPADGEGSGGGGGGDGGGARASPPPASATNGTGPLRRGVVAGSPPQRLSDAGGTPGSSSSSRSVAAPSWRPTWRERRGFAPTHPHPPT